MLIETFFSFMLKFEFILANKEKKINIKKNLLHNIIFELNHSLFIFVCKISKGICSLANDSPFRRIDIR
jgi:hypothetical protein